MSFGTPLPGASKRGSPSAHHGCPPSQQRQDSRSLTHRTCNRWATRRQTIRSAADSHAAARDLAESLDQGRNSLNGKRDGHLAMRPIPGRRGAHSLVCLRPTTSPSVPAPSSGEQRIRNMIQNAGNRDASGNDSESLKPACVNLAGTGIASNPRLSVPPERRSSQTNCALNRTPTGTTVNPKRDGNIDSAPDSVKPHPQ